MKILFVNTVIKDGSTGSILFRMQESFRRRGHETLFLYGRGEHPEEKDAVRVTPKWERYLNAALARAFGTQGYLSFISAKKIENAVRKFSPDVAVLGNLHGYYLNENRLFALLRERNLPTFYYMFDEYPYHGKCAYAGDCERYRNGCTHCEHLSDYPKTIADRSGKIFSDKKKNYRGMNNLYFLSTKQNCRRALLSPLMEGKEDKVLPIAWGIDVRNTYRPTDNEELRRAYSLDPDKPIVLAVSELSDRRKGIRDIFFPMAEQSDGSVQFLHIGNDDPSVKVPEHCLSLPFVKDQSLLSAFCTMADLFVLTSREDTYPTVSLIAQSCGTPMAGFRTSGIPDTACPETAALFAPDDGEGFTAFVLGTKKKTREVSDLCRAYALAHFDAEGKAEELEKMMEEALGK